MSMPPVYCIEDEYAPCVLSFHIFCLTVFLSGRENKNKKQYHCRKRGIKLYSLKGNSFRYLFSKYLDLNNTKNNVYIIELFQLLFVLIIIVVLYSTQVNLKFLPKKSREAFKNYIIVSTSNHY